MVMKMNKKEFVKALQTKTNYDEEKCILINNILEKHFLIGKKNKEEIVNEIKEKLNISSNEADEIYNISIGIITKELKEVIKHPFKSK